MKITLFCLLFVATSYAQPPQKSAPTQEKNFVDRLLDEQEKDLKKLRQLKHKIEANLQKNSASFEADMKRIGNNLKTNFNQLTNRINGTIVPEAAFPKIDVLDEKTNYLIVAEVPGLSKKDIVLKLMGQDLTLSGTRTNKVSKIEEAFSRTVHLQDLIDPKTLRSEVTNGILTIQLKKL